MCLICFFSNDPDTTEIYTYLHPLSLHNALPIYIPDNGIFAGATENFAITRPVNASDGVLKRVEIGLTYFPTYLPSILDGLGFQGSVTILDSKQNIPMTRSEEHTSDIQSLMRISYAVFCLKNKK